MLLYYEDLKLRKEEEERLQDAGLVGCQSIMRMVSIQSSETFIGTT